MWHPLQVHDWSIQLSFISHLTWRDMTWRDMTWHDMTWHDMTWHDMSRHVTSCHITSRHVTAQHGTAWHGMKWSSFLLFLRQMLLYIPLPPLPVNYPSCILPAISLRKIRLFVRLSPSFCGSTWTQSPVVGRKWRGYNLSLNLMRLTPSTGPLTTNLSSLAFSYC